MTGASANGVEVDGRLLECVLLAAPNAQAFVRQRRTATVAIIGVARGGVVTAEECCIWHFFDCAGDVDAEVQSVAYAACHVPAVIEDESRVCGRRRDGDSRRRRVVIGIDCVLPIARRRAPVKGVVPAECRRAILNATPLTGLRPSRGKCIYRCRVEILVVRLGVNAGGGGNANGVLVLIAAVARAAVAGR